MAATCALALTALSGLLIAVALPSGGPPPPRPTGDAVGPTTAASSVATEPASASTVSSALGDTSHGRTPEADNDAGTRGEVPAPPSLVGTGATLSPRATGRASGAADTIGAATPAPWRGPRMPRSIPIFIQIPSIGVRSRLLLLGLNDDGTIEVPPLSAQLSQAGWYEYSPTPGEIGPSVIVGHVDSAENGPAVFYRLGELNPGDRVLVRRSDGTTGVFRVNRTVRYSKDRFPTAEVYGNIDHAGLRLITCGGSFDFSTGSYRDNIVVYASLVEARPSPSSSTPGRSHGTGR